MTIFDNYEVWFVIGSQHLYGPETLRQVTQHAEHVVNALNTEAKLPCKLVLKPLGTTPDEITAICRDANYDDRCAGLVVWLHTFSPAKMWINGLTMLNKPLLQFHTQFNAALPWDSIDMDFMNLNQTAHGGREFGFIGARMRQQHAVVTVAGQSRATRWLTAITPTRPVWGIRWDGPGRGRSTVACCTTVLRRISTVNRGIRNGC